MSGPVFGRARTTEIRAEIGVAAPQRAVFDFLARLENHWEIADRWVEVVHLDSDGGNGRAVNGGAVRVRGPLGISRVARTRVSGIDPPARITGRAEIGRRTSAEVTWSLACEPPAAEGESGLDSDPRRHPQTGIPSSRTRISLAVELCSMGSLDALLWRLGGRRWMQRRFEGVLAGLAGQLEDGERRLRALAAQPT